MKTSIKRVIGLILVLAMILSMASTVFAATPSNFTDFPTGWSKEAMEAAVANGLLYGYDNNEIRPQANLTRAELAAIITRSFGAKTVADISAYTDVPKSEWYYDSIAKAVKMGALNGVSTTEMAPDRAITREEVFTAFARILVLSSNNTESLNKFKDKANISSWAVASVAALAERGYVNGDDKGYVNPQENITREEFAQLMHNAICTYITQPGTYANTFEGIVVVRVGGVVFNGSNITSDLVIGDGALTDTVSVLNTKIENRILLRGGTLTFTNTTAGENVVVNNVNGITKINNFRIEALFNGIVEKTTAEFLIPPMPPSTGSGGGTTRPSGTNKEIYTVDFYVDGFLYDTIELTNGEPDKTVTDPTKVGYTFDGWYNEDSQKVTDLSTIKEDTKLTANFNIVTYNVEFQNEDGTPFTYWKSVTPALTFDVLNPYILPLLTDVERAGYTFNGWFKEDKTTAYGATIEVDATTPATTVVVGKFTLIPPTPVVYTLTLTVDGQPYDTVVVTDGVPDKTVTDPTKVGYTFDGWYDGNTPVTDFAAVTGDATLEAKFNIVTYNVEFQNEDGTPFTYWKSGAPALTFDVENPYVLPLSSDVERAGYTFNGWFKEDKTTAYGTTIEVDATTPATTIVVGKFTKIPDSHTIYTLNLMVDGQPYDTVVVTDGVPDKTVTDPTKVGYTFDGWYDGNTPVTDFAAVTSDLTLNAKFSIVTYKVEFRNEDGTPFTYWKSGTPALTFDAENPYVLPLSSDVERTGYTFNGWFKEDKTTAYGTTIEVDATTPATTVIVGKFTIKSFKVTFYEGYNDEFDIDFENVEYGDTVSALPAIEDYMYKKGYKENASIADVYAGEDYIHTIKPSYWYVDETNKLVPFDETVVIKADTDVYLLSKAFTMFLTFTDQNQTLSTTAYFNDDTRAINSLKDIAVSGRNQLLLALSMNLVPQYDEATAKLFAKLEDLGVIKVDGSGNKNIQVLKIPVAISTFVTETATNKMLEDHIRDAVVAVDVVEINKFSAFVPQNYLDLIAAYGVNLIDYISGLSETDRKTFANVIYSQVVNDAEYQSMLHDLLNEETINIDSTNHHIASMFLMAIRDLTFEQALAHTHSSLVDTLIDVVGEPRVKEYYKDMTKEYCDNLEIAINGVVSSGAAEDYTTSLTLKLDVINDVYVNAYAKAFDLVEDKLNAADVKYNENKYLKYLVQHDILAKLLNGDSSLKTEEFTGYSLKELVDYYDYALMLLIVADDALTWYGDEANFTDAQVTEVVDAIFAKSLIAHGKVNDLLKEFVATGKLPSKAQSAIESVSRVNDLFVKYQDNLKTVINKYLASEINIKIENGQIPAQDKIIKGIDVLLGKDDPVVTIDTLYSILYNYDDNIQAKLKELVDSGKLTQAVDKLESTVFGGALSGNGTLGTVADKLNEFNSTGKISSVIDSVEDLIIILAEEGLEPFRVEKDDITVVDSYEIKVGTLVFKLKRYYQ